MSVDVASHVDKRGEGRIVSYDIYTKNKKKIAMLVLY